MDERKTSSDNVVIPSPFPALPVGVPYPAQVERVDTTDDYVWNPDLKQWQITATPVLPLPAPVLPPPLLHRQLGVSEAEHCKTCGAFTTNDCGTCSTCPPSDKCKYHFGHKVTLRPTRCSLCGRISTAGGCGTWCAACLTR